MANLHSLEIGWIITKPESDDYYDGGKDSVFFNSILVEQVNADSSGYFVPGTRGHDEACTPDVLNIETHPCDLTRVFVSWNCCLGHGDTHLTEPKALGQLVREFIAKHDPEAIVTWGIIETER